MTYADLIAEEIRKRRITRLCHFTKTSKLLHILSSEEGILATHFLDVSQEDILTRNDQSRFDGHTEYISCSVEYPNTWYLNRIKNSDLLFKDWVIVFINPDIMCNPQTKFCHRNAAAGSGAYIKTGLDGFKGMFESSVFGQTRINRTSKMLSCCPTDGQAEVLVYKKIPRSKILSVAVSTVERARITDIMVKHIEGAPLIKWIIAPDLFNTNWNSLVKSGNAPEELVFNNGGE